MLKAYNYTHAVALPVALWAALVQLLAVLISADATAAADGTCSGAGANPLVYNFAVDGNPAKVIADSSRDSEVPGLFLEDPAVLSRALKRRFLNESGITTGFNVLYIDKNGEGILIDTGLGPASSGNLFNMLEMEGIPKESIKHVVLTHGHADHLSGLVLNNTADVLEPAFPEATVYISRIEYEYWTTDPVDSGTTLRSAENQASAVSNAQAVLGAVKDSIKTFEIEEEPLPGFMPILTPWHTPGSVAYSITDGDSKLLVSGDAVNHRVLTIENPWVNTSSIDFDREAGPAGRYELLDKVVKERWQFFAFHSEFPGLMYVDHCGSNFITTQAQYKGSVSATAVCMDE